MTPVRSGKKKKRKRTRTWKEIGMCGNSVFILLLLGLNAMAFSPRGQDMRKLGQGSSKSSVHVATSLKTAERRTTSDILSLESIRSSLIRQEETIIFALIERAQFLSNDVVYSRKDGLLSDKTPRLPLGARVSVSSSEGDLAPLRDVNEERLRCVFYFMLIFLIHVSAGRSTNQSITQINPRSFMEYMLVGTEILHSEVRRYTSPEEHAFFPEFIPPPLGELAKLEYPDDLLSDKNGASSCCLNSVLLERYVKQVIPMVCKEGDDEQHGSSVLADVAVLQALSKRIHYGKFVAESKFRADPEGYQRLVDQDDVDGVMKLLTNSLVEEKVLKRAKMKCATCELSQTPANQAARFSSIFFASTHTVCFCFFFFIFFFLFAAHFSHGPGLMPVLHFPL